MWEINVEVFQNMNQFKYILFIYILFIYLYIQFITNNQYIIAFLNIVNKKYFLIVMSKQEANILKTPWRKIF